MGAEQFDTFSTGKTVEEAFLAAREQAFYDHGHSGYSGTIAEKGEFQIRHTEPMTLAEAQSFAEHDLETNDHDKWGPAWAVPVKDETRVGWLFYGYASS